MNGIPPESTQFLEPLAEPSDIQDFLNTLTIRTDDREPIVRSPAEVFKKKAASCMEGALFAAAALMHHGEDPLIMDLRVAERSGDVDHVVALFKRNGLWGALSKTSHSVLRYREPVYKNPRELALSYFHEYFLNDGTKTLRAYSEPFDVKKRFGVSWVTSDADLYEIAYELDASEHHDILPPGQEKELRKADTIEIAAGKLKEK